MRGAGLELAPDPLPKIWAQAIDRAPDQPPAVPPSPRPPVSARPVELPVTAVERLIRDPYDIYASRILKLRALDPLDEEPGPRLKGDMIHAAFEQLAKDIPGIWRASDWPRLRTIGQAQFARLAHRPAIHALWWRRFEKAARWLLDQEANDPAPVVRRFAEIKGVHPGLPGLADFRLTAKADRIDVMSDGKCAHHRLQDRHTADPAADQGRLRRQMPLQGLILRDGGFADVGAAELTDLVHVRVHGAREGGQVAGQGTAGRTAGGYGDRAGADDRGYRDPETPYLSRPGAVPGLPRGL